MNDPSAEQIRARHDALLDRLRAISEASGHDPARLRIVAVTKARPIAVARRAMEAGLTRLGESRVQEGEPKVAALPEAEWHFIARLNKEGHTVLLTTHYLEEAEALCGRIAMLKSGRIVALNRTSELLQAASGSVLQFKTDAALPPALNAIARVTGRIVQLPAHDAAEIESHLAALRVGGVDVHDMEIRRPDLEDVFLQVLSGTSASNIPPEGVAL